MTENMKDSGIEWIGEIPENWDVKRTKHIANYHKNVVGSKERNYERLALTLAGVLKRSKTSADGLQPKDFFTYQILNKDDLVFKLIDLKNVSTSRVGLSPYNGIVSPAYIAMTPNKEKINNIFLYYFFYSMWQREIFNKMGNDGVRSAIGYKELNKIPVIVPPLDVQKKIADYLDEQCSKIDALRDRTQSELDNLKAYKQSLITELVTKGMNPDVAMKDSGVEWISEIPENWDTNKVKYVFSNHKGLSITKANLIDTGLPVISYGQVHSKKNNGTREVEDLIRYVNESYANANKKSKVNVGDFIFADTSEDYEGVGNAVYNRTNTNLFAGYHTIVLHSKTVKDNRYFAYLFLTDCWRRQMREQAYGVKVLSITQKMLLNSSILIPPVEEQKAIADYLDEKCAILDRLIDIKAELLTQLDEYKKSLIYEYVTGKQQV